VLKKKRRGGQMTSVELLGEIQPNLIDLQPAGRSVNRNGNNEMWNERGPGEMSCARAPATSSTKSGASYTGYRDFLDQLDAGFES